MARIQINQILLRTTTSTIAMEKQKGEINRVWSKDIEKLIFMKLFG